MKPRLIFIELSMALSTIFILLWIFVPKFMGAQTINNQKYFPDPVVFNAVREVMGVSENEPFTKNQAAQYKGEIVIGKCENIKGLEFFRGITALTVECHNLENIDLSMYPYLELVVLKSNNTVSVNTDGNLDLKEFTLQINPQLREVSDPIQINVSNNAKLYYLNLNNCPIISIDLRSNPELFHLAIYSVGSRYNLNSLDITQNKNLAALFLSGHQLETLDVSHLHNLYILRCNLNQINNLELADHPKLSHLECNQNFIKELNVSTISSLKTLSCFGNLITELLLPSTYSNLEYLRCYNNDLKQLDIKTQLKLKTLQAQNNPLQQIVFSEHQVQWIETDRFEWNKYDIPQNKNWPMGYIVPLAPSGSIRIVGQNVNTGSKQFVNPVPDFLSEESKRNPFVFELFREVDSKLEQQFGHEHEWKTKLKQEMLLQLSPDVSLDLNELRIK